MQTSWIPAAPRPRRPDMFSLLDAAAGFAQLGDYVLAGTAPWRFLFSSRYREQVCARWRDRPPHVAAFQQVMGVLVVIIELVVMMLLIDAFRRP